MSRAHRRTAGRVAARPAARDSSELAATNARPPVDRRQPDDTVPPVSVERADFDALAGLVGTMRDWVAAQETEPLRPRVVVGGMPAAAYDYAQVIRAWTPAVIGLVVLGTFLVLSLAFHVPFVAAKAVLLHLLSIGATFGFTTLVFVDGHGLRLLGASQSKACFRRSRSSSSARSPGFRWTTRSS